MTSKTCLSWRHYFDISREVAEATRMGEIIQE